jgi:hypothetical protein
LGFSRPVIILLIGGRMTLRSVAASGCLIDSNDILGPYEDFSMVEFCLWLVMWSRKSRLEKINNALP